MTVYFFDSSALYKRYVYEPGSGWVRARCSKRGDENIVIISQIARIEIIAALYRMGRLTGQQPALVDAAVAEFEQHLARSRPSRKRIDRPYRIIPLTESIVEMASALRRKYRDLTPHPLRTLDALQLASALVSRRLLADSSQSEIESVTFVTADARLLAITALEGFQTENPALYA